MPARNQSLIRRGINRLHELIRRLAEKYPALDAIAGIVEEKTVKVNGAWQNYQNITVNADKEREERDTAIDILLNWVQYWRPVIMLLVPGASENIRTLPVRGATPDDIIHVAEDMQVFINNTATAETFRQKALDDLETKLDDAKKETSEASEALPAEAAARAAYSEACIEANEVLVRGLEIVRAIFGRTSPEYKQFIARASAAEEEEIDKELELEETENTV